MIDTTLVEHATNLTHISFWGKLVNQLIHFAVTYGPNILIAGIILILGHFISKVIASFFIRSVGRRLDIARGEFIKSLIYYLLIILVVMFALDKLGVATSSLVTILGAAGLAVGLAIKDSLANLASGIMLVITHPFKKGDYVSVAGDSGLVHRITMFHTILDSTDNKRLIVPNSSVTANHIINYSANATRRVDLIIGISYDDDIKVAKEVLQKIIADDTRVLSDPEPLVAVDELGDSSVNFVMRPWVKSEDYWAVYRDMTERAKILLEEAGCSIPFPQRDVHIIHEVGKEKVSSEISVNLNRQKEESRESDEGGDE